MLTPTKCFLQSAGIALLTMMYSFQTADAQSQSCKENPNQDTCQALYQVNASTGDSKGLSLTDLSDVTVSLDEDDASASIKFVFPWLSHKFTVTVSSPLDSDSGRAEFIGSNDVIGAKSAKVEYLKINWPAFLGYPEYLAAAEDKPQLLQEGEEKLQRSVWSCVKGVGWLRQQASERPGTLTKALDELQEESEDFELPNANQVERYFELFGVGEQVGEPEEKIAVQEKLGQVAAFEDRVGGPESFCSRLEEHSAGSLAMEGKGRGSLVVVENNNQRASLPVFFYGLSASASDKEFEFLDRDSLSSDTPTKADRHENPWSVGIKTGWFFLSADEEKKRQSALILSADFAQGYEAGDSVTFCQPVEGSESVDSIRNCEELPIGEPNPMDSMIYAIEYRHAFKHFGITARTFYQDSDDKESDFGIELPIYFLRNGEGDFQGGVRLGWSDQEDEQIAIFVGKTFSIE